MDRQFYVPRTKNEEARCQEAANAVIATMPKGQKSQQIRDYIDGLVDACEKLTERNPAFYRSYIQSLRDFIDPPAPPP